MVAPVYMLSALPGKKTQEIFVTLRACLHGGRVTLASGSTLAGGQKIARVYKQNITVRVTRQSGTT